MAKILMIPNTMSPCVWYKTGAGDSWWKFFSPVQAPRKGIFDSAIGDLKSTGSYPFEAKLSRANSRQQRDYKRVFERGLEERQDALFRCKDALTDGIACKAIESMKVKLLPSIITV